MSKLSKEKEEKIMSNIVAILYQHSPEAIFTSEISKLEARDEEFIKRLLQELEKKKLVVCVEKNSKGIKYARRQRWRLSNNAYEVYKKYQSAQIKSNLPLTDNIEDKDIHYQSQ